MVVAPADKTKPTVLSVPLPEFPGERPNVLTRLTGSTAALTAEGTLTNDPAFNQALKELQKLPPRERGAALHRLMKENDRERKAAQARRAANEQLAKRLTRLDQALTEFVEFGKTDPQMERPEASKMDRLRKTMNTGHALYMDWVYQRDQPLFDYYGKLVVPAQTLLVQHDWEALFEGATELKDAQFRLPYENCAFEFQWGGRAHIMLVEQEDDIVYSTLAMELAGGPWLISSRMRSPVSDLRTWTDPFGHIKEVPGSNLFNQVRAICIALEAEVAEAAEPIREPHNSRGNNPPGALPAFRVVQLAHRRAARPRSLPSSPGSGRRKRLHFRRGHWVHYRSHKTWRKWQLVGNPDLGFVDKEYRL